MRTVPDEQLDSMDISTSCRCVKRRQVSIITGIDLGSMTKQEIYCLVVSIVTAEAQGCLSIGTPSLEFGVLGKQ